MTCRFCGEAPRDAVDAGGTVGVACRSCFVEWDRAQEAAELADGWKAVSTAMPDPSCSHEPIGYASPPRTSRVYALDGPTLRRSVASPRTVLRAMQRLAARGIQVGRAA